MRAHKSLRHVIKRTSAPARSAPSQPSAGTARTWATSGILALALLPGGLGVASPAAHGHASASRVHATAHKSAARHTASAGATLISSGSRPWMW
jgi:hypothetical protein